MRQSQIFRKFASHVHRLFLSTHLRERYRTDSCITPEYLSMHPQRHSPTELQSKQQNWEVNIDTVESNPQIPSKFLHGPVMYFLQKDSSSELHHALFHMSPESLSIWISFSVFL